MADFELSTYQKDILDYFIKNPKDNIYINALAGSGKSSTICLLTETTKTSDVYLAFNKSIAEEFKTKIKNPKTKVYTMHGLMYMIMLNNLERLKQPKAVLDNLKIYKIVDEKIQQNYKYDKFEYKVFLRENYVQLYNLYRLTCASLEDIDSIMRLVNEYNLFRDFNNGGFAAPSKENIRRWLSYIDSRSKEEFINNNIIDFTDMLYTTWYKLNNKEWEVPYYLLFTNVYVDEAQDLSTIQLFLLKYIKRSQGRYVVVLDRNQAIYGFAGANCNSYKLIQSLYNPFKEFDLPINYRCPKSHLDLINSKFGIPIQPRSDAPIGKIKTILKENISQYIQKGDFVIARKNKWLASVIMDLIKNNIPIYIEDSDMVGNIFKTIKKAKSYSATELFNNLKKKELDYQKNMQKTRENNTITDSEKENLIVDTNSFIDNIEFILTILSNFLKNNSKATSLDFEKYLKKMLNTVPNKDCVRLSSIHKCKGLESSNTFVLNEGKVCFDPRNSFDLNQQEKNLSYISLTRAKNNMYLVREDSENKD